MKKDIFEHGVSYNADCMEVFKTIPDKSIDLILTDPPYIVNTTGAGASAFSKRAQKNTKNLLKIGLTKGIDYEAIFGEMLRVCKIPNILVFCSNNQAPDFMNFFMERKLSTTLLVWNKTNAMPIRNSHYICNTEFIVYARGRNATYNYSNLPIEYNRKVYTSPCVPVKHRVHPTQKPMEYLARLIQVHSRENDTVLDCFAGSGTTGLAAAKLNRNFILVEQSLDFYERQIDFLKKQNV